MKPRKSKDKKTLLEAAHEMAKGLHKAGVIDKTTMREFDVLCLSPIKEFSSKEIKISKLSTSLHSFSTTSGIRDRVDTFCGPSPKNSVSGSSQ